MLVNSTPFKFLLSSDLTGVKEALTQAIGLDTSLRKNRTVRRRYAVGYLKGKWVLQDTKARSLLLIGDCFSYY